VRDYKWGHGDTLTVSDTKQPCLLGSPLLSSLAESVMLVAEMTWPANFDVPLFFLRTELELA